MNRGPYGENSYEGFIPDVIQKIATRLRAPYKIQIVKNGAYGVPTKDGSWNGMIGEVIRGVTLFILYLYAIKHKKKLLY